MRLIAGIFGVVCGTVVVAIVARYGYMSASTHYDGLISAALFGIIATGGLVGHAVAARIWRNNKIGATVIFLIATAALLVNLSNSVGFIAGRSDVKEAARAQSLEQSRRNNAALDRLIKERSNLPRHQPVTEASVKAAKDAVSSAEKIRVAECQQRGNRCRQREQAEQQARNKVVALETNLAVTKQAARLDAKIEKLQQKLATSAPVSKADAQTAALSAIFALPAATASSYQKLIMAAVAELLIVASFLTVEWLRPEPKPGLANITAKTSSDSQSVEQSVTKVPTPPVKKRKTKLKVPKKQLAQGEVSVFIKACLEPNEEGQVVIKDLYAPYKSWCQAERLEPHPAKDFEQQFLAVIDEAGFPNKAGLVDYLQLKQAA